MRGVAGRAYWVRAMYSSEVTQGERTGQGGAISAAELRASCQHYFIGTSDQICKWRAYWAGTVKQVFSPASSSLSSAFSTPSDLFQVVARAQINKKKEQITRHSTSATRGLHKFLFCVVLQPFCEYPKRRGTEIRDHNFFYLIAAVAE